MRALRWIAFLPLAVVASALAGALVALLGEFFAGGANWYTWLVSGAASGTVFCYVAFRIAPSATRGVKWVVVGCVGVVGVIALVRPIIDGDVLRALQGVGLLVMAVAYVRQSPQSLRDNPEGTKDFSSATAA